MLAYIVFDQIYLNRKNLIWYEFKISRRKRIKKSFVFLFIILVSFLITKIWVSHTDNLKILLGGYAEQLTSSNLKSWNYDFISE